MTDTTEAIKPNTPAAKVAAVLAQIADQRADEANAAFWLGDNWHDGMPAPSWTSHYDDDVKRITPRMNFYAATREEFAAVLRALAKGAPIGSVPKEPSEDGDYMEATRSFGVVQVRVITLRTNVCVRRRVGTETVRIPDPAKAAEVPMVDVERPVYEYDCGDPILGEAASE